MPAIAIEPIAAWVQQAGMAGLAEPELLDGFCRRCIAAGVPLSRALLLVDTLHPVFEGRAFVWRAADEAIRAPIEYGSSSDGERAESWQASIFHHLLSTGGDERRCRLGPDDPMDFRALPQMRAEGQTDYFVMIHRFGDSGKIGEMDGVYSDWVTDAPEGFTDHHLDALRQLLPSVVLAVKAASLARIATTLVEVYLGRDAGERVLRGSMGRGVAERIDAVLWFSDLRGYTSISGSADPGEIIPMLNDYAEAVVSAVHGAGGDVLKLIGDGALAIFRADDPANACRAALAAEADLRARTGDLNRRRAAEGRPVTTVYLGLHIGEVFYGNIGSQERLDFTVIGPAVNEVSRIGAMCRSVERSVVMSAAFASATPEPERAGLVSVGRYALRGLERARELFTLDGAPTLPDEDPRAGA